MLYPQHNPYRQVHQLATYWQIQFDPDGQGLDAGWTKGLPQGRPVAVPASWNDQFENSRDFLGPAWYQVQFDRPWGWDRQAIYLRFGSVNYLADVWLNGVHLGSHEGGHLPFEFLVSEQVEQAGNLLIVRVDGDLASDRVPPGNITGGEIDFFAHHDGIYPQTQFDFFPYCGLHRPVVLYASTPGGIRDITVKTEIDGSTGIVDIRVEHGLSDAEIHYALNGQSLPIVDGSRLIVENASFWSPESPSLYDLTVDLTRDGEVLDRYTLPVGIRTIHVEGSTLLLNNEAIHLKGFGRHEDFPIVGRGLPPAAVIRDFEIMKGLGANSFRTTHYPYSEEMMFLADRLGFLVIDETPAVGLFFRESGLERRTTLVQQYTRELIARDKNHPSVIMWCLANEPHSLRPAAKPIFQELYTLAKSLDDSRPVSIVSFTGVPEDSFDFLDVVCVNRYHGWYFEQGRIADGVDAMEQGIEAVYKRYQKPVVLTEFGADALAGWHADPPEMFSEEYQAEMIKGYIERLADKPYVAGTHVWCLCDFKTSQSTGRAASLNTKGVFTRDRKPKLAAHTLRALWKGGGEQ
ncbi:MAG: hypothetical protein GYB68_13280 [Chloroflexi bacterium]|nr:hypothetical protein [Chloroflexota bacterium]